MLTTWFINQQRNATRSRDLSCCVAEKVGCGAEVKPPTLYQGYAAIAVITSQMNGADCVGPNLIVDFPQLLLKGV